MELKIRDAKPKDAATIQRISAAGYKRSFAHLHSAEYLELKIQEYLSPTRIEKMANIIRDKNSITIVAENATGEVVGSVCGKKDENNNWQLIALYLDENVIGDIKFALTLVKEFSQRIKKLGATKFTTGTLSGSRVCKLYELLGGKKIKEYQNEKRESVWETDFEFDLDRFLK